MSGGGSSPAEATATPPDRAQLVALIQGALRDLVEDFQLKGWAEIDEQTVLYGGGRGLDSMALVHLIAEVEGRLSEQHGIDLILADERAMSQMRSPFRRVGVLADTILERLQAGA